MKMYGDSCSTGKRTKSDVSAHIQLNTLKPGEPGNPAVPGGPGGPLKSERNTINTRSKKPYGYNYSKVLKRCLIMTLFSE